MMNFHNSFWEIKCPETVEYHNIWYFCIIYITRLPFQQWLSTVISVSENVFTSIHNKVERCLFF